MFDYVRSAETATRLLKNFGKQYPLTSVTTGVYNPATSTVETTETTAQVYAVVFDATGDDYAQEFVQAGDKYAIIEPSASVKVGDKLTYKGETWGVYRVAKQLAPAETIVLWKVYVRK